MRRLNAVTEAHVLCGNKMSEFNLALTLKEEFDLQLNQLKRFTKHGPSLGRFVELSLINLLSKYFPKNISFSSGFIHSMNPSTQNKSSSQLDIICFDRINYPIIFDINEIKIVTPLAVKGIIEVKSTLTKNAIDQVLTLSQQDVMQEVDLNSKINLISVNSSIRPKTAFDYIKTYYDQKPMFNKFLGSIISLDWHEMLSFHVSKKENNIKYSCNRINIFDDGIASFISDLLYSLCGEQSLKSIINILAPSINPLLEKFSIEMYTK